MKALRWYGREDLRYEDVPEPSPGPGEVKIKVHWTGICGSDLHEYSLGPIFVKVGPSGGVTLGHEFSGEVVEIGKGVTSLKLGDRIAGDAPQYCGKCYFCMRNQIQHCLNGVYTGIHCDGSMAEYVVVPDYSCYKLADSIPDEIGALVEPLEVGFHAVQRSKLGLGDTVVIIGAGTIGLSTFLSARAAGASKIFILELIKSRGERTLAMGANAFINPNEVDAAEEIRNLTGGLGADVSFDCAGTPDTGPLAVELARKLGTVVIVGMAPAPSPNFNFFNLFLTERTVLGSIGYGHEGDHILGLIADGRIDPSKFITSKVALKDAEEKGFKEALTNPEKQLKILVHP